MANSWESSSESGPAQLIYGLDRKQRGCNLPSKNFQNRQSTGRNFHDGIRVRLTPVLPTIANCLEFAFSLSLSRFGRTVGDLTDPTRMRRREVYCCTNVMGSPNLPESCLLQPPCHVTDALPNVKTTGKLSDVVEEVANLLTCIPRYCNSRDASINQPSARIPRLLSRLDMPLEIDCSLSVKPAKPVTGLLAVDPWRSESGVGRAKSLPATVASGPFNSLATAMPTSQDQIRQSHS